MSNPNNIINPFTPPNLDAIKSQFVAENSTDSPVVQESIILDPQGKPAISTEEPVLAEEPAPNVKFFPYPKSGNILAALQHPEQDGTIALCVNIQPDDTQEPKPLCVAITRVLDVALMICDGVNYTWKARQLINQEEEARKEACQVTDHSLRPDEVAAALETSRALDLAVQKARGEALQLSND